jgi:hypothetical protein
MDGLRLGLVVGQMHGLVVGLHAQGMVVGLHAHGLVVGLGLGLVFGQIHGLVVGLRLGLIVGNTQGMVMVVGLQTQGLMGREAGTGTSCWTNRQWLLWAAASTGTNGGG